VKLKNLNPVHLQGLYRAKLDEKVSPRTVAYVHDLIKQALKQARRWGLVAQNVAEAVNPPTQHRKEMKCLSHEQARLLLDSARGDRLEPSTCWPSLPVYGRMSFWASSGSTLTSRPRRSP